MFVFAHKRVKNAKMRIAEISSGLGVAIISGLSPLVWNIWYPHTPLPNVIVYSGVVVGLLLIAWGFFHDRIIKPKFETVWLRMMKLHPNRENLIPFRRAIPIKEAAQIAYDHTHDTGMAGIAEGWAKGRAGMEELGTYAQYFLDLGGYTLYGKRPASGVYRAVPVSEISSLRLSPDLTKLMRHGQQDRPEYVDIVVTKADLNRLIVEAKEIDRETARAQTTAKFKPSKDAKMSQGVPPEKINVVVKKAERDTKMHEALAYVESGLWGKTFSEYVMSEYSKTGGKSPNLVRQAALDGEIRIWGKASQNGPHIQIDSDYWKIWQIEYFSTMEGKSKTELAEVGYNAGTTYYDLMVSKTEIENKWPANS